MNRREVMLGTLAIGLWPSTALARDKTPKLSIEVVANVTHRRKPVERKRVVLRFVIYTSMMDRNPTWEDTQTLNIVEGRLETTLSKGLGTIEDNGDLRLNLIIRAIVTLGGCSYAQAGGGIVVDSTPEYERNENRIKAQALLDTLQ